MQGFFHVPKQDKWTHIFKILDILTVLCMEVRDILNWKFIKPQGDYELRTIILS